MSDFHLEIVDIILAGVAVVSGFAGRLWWHFLSRNIEQRARHFSSSDSARTILVVAIVMGILAGGSTFLGGLILPLRGGHTLQEFAFEALLIGVLVMIGVAIGYLLASLLLRRGRRREQP
jgi:uncharacterized membrane protein YdjX (TVP38/TMEM64 family)